MCHFVIISLVMCVINTEKLIELRKKKGLTQSQLAEKIGISDAHLSHVEKGKVGMSLATLKATIQVLETTAEELLGDDMLVPLSAPGIVFEYSVGKRRKARFVLPANLESYAFLTEQIALMNLEDDDPRLEEITEKWSDADDTTKEKVYSALKKLL